MKTVHCPSTEVAYNTLATLAMQQVQADAEPCWLVSLDFDNFNYINDLFGYAVGDEVLARFRENLKKCLKPGEHFCHLHADHHLLWLHLSPSDPILRQVAETVRRIGDMEGLLPSHYTLVHSVGIAQAISAEEPFSSLMDKANFARKRAKGNYQSTVLRYDSSMDEEMQWRKTLTLLMEPALHNQEFEMYLQPKVILQTGQIVGAEALVRWNSQQYGLIEPDRFIPIMEQNGFVRQLDFFMLGEACKYLKNAIVHGEPAVPISVNFSKVHLRDIHFVEQVFQEVTSYDLSPHLIEIEFTETMLAGDFQPLIDAASALKCLGFHIVLDDFGSAYSSLNCLKALPLDVIKLDKHFLEDTTDTERGRIIIAKVVELIKSLRMVCVMEGVERADQVEFLKRLGCDVAQGYFYARPMPASQYSLFVRSGEVVEDIREALNAASGEMPPPSIPEEFQMDNWELYTLGKNIDIGLMKVYLNDDLTVQYINDRALEYVEYTRQELREVFHNHFFPLIHPADADRVHNNIQLLIREGKPLKYQTHLLRKDGKTIVVQGRCSCVLDNQGRPVGLYAFQDVTEELERTRQYQQSMQDKITELEQTLESLRMSEERYRVVMDQSDDILFDWDYQTDCISISEKYRNLFGRDAICEHFSTNPGVRARIHPQEIEDFEHWIRATYHQPNCAQTEFRIEADNGRYLWVQARSTAICDANGIPIRGICVLRNITAQKQELEALTYKAQMDPLTKLLNKEETQLRIEHWLSEHSRKPAAFFIIDVDNFKAVNDCLGHQIGDHVLLELAHKVRRLFRHGDIIGRIGGDEIIIFAAGMRAKEDLLGRGDLLVQMMREINLEAAPFALSVSIGIAQFPAHGKDFETLYRLADIALYQAKQNGKGCSAIYEESMQAQSGSNRTPVDWLAHTSRYYKSDFAYSAFEALYETHNPVATIDHLLEEAGMRFALDQVVVFRKNMQSETFTPAFCWNDLTGECGEHCELLLEDAYRTLYLNQYTDQGVFACEDVSSLPSPLRRLLQRQGITACCHCVLKSLQDPEIIVAFHLSDGHRHWSEEDLATLSYFSRMISIFLPKVDELDDIHFLHPSLRS